MTAPAKYLVRKIRQGKFIKLHKLLPPVLDKALTTQLGKRSGGSKRCIGDFASWMEAWCIFMAIRVHAFPEISAGERVHYPCRVNILIPGQGRCQIDGLPA